MNPLFAILALLAGSVGAVTFWVMHRRNTDILNRHGPHERRAYARLRRSLAAEGLAARTYARWLEIVLHRVDRFFGDADLADQTLFPRAFGLRTPAPLWTAAAFDRCLILALVYPIVTVFVIWAISGHVGPAEHMLGLAAGVAGWHRALLLVAMVLSAYSAWRGLKAEGWKVLLWYAGAAGGGGLVAGFGALAGGFAVAFVYTAAVDGAGAYTVAYAVAYVVAEDVAFAYSDAVAVAFVGVVAAAFAAGVFVGVVVGWLKLRATRGGWQGPFEAGLVFSLALLCFAAAVTLGDTPAWVKFGPIILFLGLLTLINAPFDWVSLGLTRALLRRGLELKKWYPYLLGLIDAAAAALVIVLLTVASVLGVQAFEPLAVRRGGAAANILPLKPLFDGIAAHPGAPEYWWVYAMLLSTMIPSLVNMAIGGATLLRGIPWITTLLLRNMPAHRAPADFERTWIALLLTAQTFIGGILGIAAQAFLAYVVIGIVLPFFGFGLLDVARGVEAADLPGAVLRSITG